jgi:hypothetical protein
MGNPNTGEIYEGDPRNEGDIKLLREQFEKLKPMSMEDRITEMEKIMAETGERERTRQGDLVQDNGTVREMPRYKCHKEVWALKIAKIVRDGEGENRETDGSAMITPAEEGYAPFKVNYDYLRKHNPQVGGYYVVYKDGYQSYSPAQPFEEGYARV